MSTAPREKENVAKRCICSLGRHLRAILLLLALPTLFLIAVPFLFLFAYIFLNILGPWVKDALLGFPTRVKLIAPGYDYTLHENPYVDQGTWYTFTSDAYDFYFEDCILFQAMKLHDGYLYFDGDGLHRIELESGKHESLKTLPVGIELCPIDVFFKQLPEG